MQHTLKYDKFHHFKPIFFPIHNELRLNWNTLILYRPWCKKTQGHLAYTKSGTYNFQIQLQK